MSIEVYEYVTDCHFDKSKCYEEFANHLKSVLGDAKATVIDVEKEWLIDTSKADYSPKIRLSVMFIVRFEE